ncbi:MAG: single-stranded DNA-binding protein [Muribaculaceae bacterium]|nr:single-stranded DNA-binding protein [Muribaculaceae bacterium]MDE5969021.1 single-stranded DNA-binding protein [Muribaculaceae bacterium]
MSVNKVILVGNVGTAPEVRYVGTRPVATLSLATNEPARTAADGTAVPERTEWHRIIMWDKAAETAERYISKGTKLYIEGKLRTRQYQDRNAITRSVTEIIVDTFDILSRPTATNQPGQSPA